MYHRTQFCFSDSARLQIGQLFFVASVLPRALCIIGNTPCFFKFEGLDQNGCSFYMQKDFSFARINLNKFDNTSEDLRHQLTNISFAEENECPFSLVLLKDMDDIDENMHQNMKEILTKLCKTLNSKIFLDDIELKQG
jgi:hypothetical protein